MTSDDSQKSSQQPVFLLKSSDQPKRECKDLKKHQAKRKSLSKCYFRRKWKCKYFQMSKDTTADCLSYQLWWMIFIPIHSSLHFQLGRSILIQFLWPITCQPSATRLLHPLAMIPWRCSTQCLQPHQCLQLRKHQHSSHQAPRTTKSVKTSSNHW